MDQADKKQILRLLERMVKDPHDGEACLALRDAMDGHQPAGFKGAFREVAREVAGEIWTQARQLTMFWENEAKRAWRLRVLKTLLMIERAPPKLPRRAFVMGRDND